VRSLRMPGFGRSDLVLEKYHAGGEFFRAVQGQRRDLTHPGQKRHTASEQGWHYRDFDTIHKRGFEQAPEENSTSEEPDVLPRAGPECRH